MNSEFDRGWPTLSFFFQFFFLFFFFPIFFFPIFKNFYYYSGIQLLTIIYHIISIYRERDRERDREREIEREIERER